MTRAESLLWLHVRNRQIRGYRFLRQYSIGCYVVDFYCPQLRLAIEADGESHATEDAVTYDRNRQEKIEAYGIQFLRFKDEEIFHTMEGVLERIETFIGILQRE